MDRKEFLSLLGATPFAFKSLVMDGTQASEKGLRQKAKDVDIPQCILKDKNGKEIALIKDFDFEITQEQVFGRPGRRSWSVYFEESHSVSDNYDRLVKALQTRETLTADLYMPENNQLFYTGEGYMTEVSIDMMMPSVTGHLQGESELIKP